MISLTVCFFAPTSSAAQSNATAPSLTFSNNHQLYDRAEDIRSLQHFLNSYGFIVAQSGPGSLGHETSTFGFYTYKALKKFQSAQGLPATGFFGPLTRGKIATFSYNSSSTAPSIKVPTSPSTLTVPRVPSNTYAPGFGGGGTSNSNPTPTQSVAPTAAIIKNIVTDFGATCNGTANDNPAFTAFNTWALNWQSAGNSGLIELDIPTGSVCEFSNTSGSGSFFAKGIKQLKVVGYGATLSDNGGAGNGFFLGGSGVIQDNIHSARTATVTAGSGSVTLLTHGQTSLFTVGSYALMAGLDMQGFGFPINPYYFEYVKITGINSSTGVVTFDAPLQNTYKSTWPLYWAGSAFEADQGGPATLYALDPSWNTEVEYRGLTISQVGQTYANGRSVTYRDVTFTGSACGIPTQNLVWQAINTTMTNCNMEVDKIIGNMTLSGVTIHQILFQSASVNVFTMTGSTVTSTVNGTPKKSVISNSTITNFSPGAYAYGTTDEVSCTDCVISALSPLGFVETLTGNGFTMSGGIISVANSHGPVTWAIPGAKIVFSGQYAYELPFTVNDVTQDGTNTYVHTSLSGGFPNIPGATIGVRTNPAPKFTCTNCTGSTEAVDLSGAPPGISLWSYSKRSYTGDSAQTLVPVWGRLTSVKVNVTKAYTGAQSSINFNIDGPFVINSAGSVTTWNPTINPKIIGERDLFPASVSGTQSGDSLSAPGVGTWLLNNQITPKLSANISGENASVWPTITIEITIDQIEDTTAPVISSIASSTAPTVMDPIFWTRKWPFLR